MFLRTRLEKTVSAGGVKESFTDVLNHLNLMVNIWKNVIIFKFNLPIGPRTARGERHYSS